MRDRLAIDVMLSMILRHGRVTYSAQ